MIPPYAEMHPMRMLASGAHSFGLAHGAIPPQREKQILAKIAVEFASNSGSTNGERPHARPLAQGNGWRVSDVVCSLGPRNRPFPERHTRPSIALVLAGTFHYRSRSGRELMTPGSVLLGSSGQSFECGHEHSEGDRCLSFSYEPHFFERLAHDAGVRRERLTFLSLRLPPLRALSPIAVAALAALESPHQAAWEEIAVSFAARAMKLDRGLAPRYSSPQPSAIAQVSRIVRHIERHQDEPHGLSALAGEARLSPYHFLRTFHCVTGVTPHQYLLRSRLRTAAVRLAKRGGKIVDVAFSSGFGDISNFNRMFRAEFATTPRSFQARPSAI
jgi:AraC-like DNA-binding protein